MSRGESNAFEIPAAAGPLWVALLERLVESGPVPCQVSAPDLWFSTDAASVEVATRSCRECPAAAACREYAVAAGESHGVWGGRSFDRRWMARAG